MRQRGVYGHLEKLISVPIADLASVNDACESEREQNRIIRRQFCGARPVGAIFRGARMKKTERSVDVTERRLLKIALDVD
jgi:hypothetical protein